MTSQKISQQVSLPLVNINSTSYPGASNVYLIFAQNTVENIFRDIEDAEVYIDNIGAFSTNWEHHIELLCTILTTL